MMASGQHTINFDGFDARVLKDIGRRTLPKRPQVTSKHNEECYYHVSIRYNLALDTSPTYTVIVGNIGNVYTGHDKAEAERTFDTYVDQSKTGQGRAGNEEVMIFENDEPLQDYYPPQLADTEEDGERFDGQG